jgi:hypothetical protein
MAILKHHRFVERERKMKILKILCVLVGIMLFPVSTPALTVISMDLRDLTANAELIFVGTVTDITIQKEPKTIYTYVIFSDLRVVKGTYLEKTIKVRLAGGSVAGVTLNIPGMPKFVVGQRNLIFLAGNFHYICPIVGWGQGRFKIRWDGTVAQDVVFDDAGIPIKEVRGNEVIRAKTAVSRPQGSSPGVPDTGGASVSQSQKLESPGLETKVSLQGFIAAIETIMGIR